MTARFKKINGSNCVLFSVSELIAKFRNTRTYNSFCFWMDRNGIYSEIKSVIFFAKSIIAWKFGR